MNIEKIKKTAYWIFKPLEFVGIIILSILGLLTLCGLGWFLFNIVLGGGILLCTHFDWPMWIGYIWLITAIWGFLRIGYSINNYCKRTNINGEII